MIFDCPLPVCSKNNDQKERPVDFLSEAQVFPVNILARNREMRGQKYGGTKINRDSEKTEPSFKSGGPEDKTGRKQDFTQGNIVKQIVAFTLPLIASSLLQALYNMVDMVMAGRFAGQIRNFGDQ